MVGLLHYLQLCAIDCVSVVRALRNMPRGRRVVTSKRVKNVFRRQFFFIVIVLLRTISLTPAAAAAVHGNKLLRCKQKRDIGRSNSRKRRFCGLSIVGQLRGTLMVIRLELFQI